MSQDRKQQYRIDPEPPLTPDFPRLRHPDLDAGETKDVDEPANRDEIEVPGEEDTRKGNAVPEPPD
ncbi:hypothetical protein [Amycolatopsis sp.]|uniref:hypothetical protein n=1 Tax=Amycolatopsis sp. TaxID=37632 RepID=UPI002CF61684|nr:hypothetical protein [Amycolatopsis sp.]HVV10349.1 hypothetical protein [Amycolatopsis sp.]